MATRPARPSYGCGVAVATKYATDGTIADLTFCATTDWSMADVPVRAEVTTCVSTGKAMQGVIRDTSYRISAPAYSTVGLEFVGLSPGATIGDIFFFTDPPAYVIAADGTATITSKGKAHWLKDTNLASFELGSDGKADVQRVTFNGDSGAVVGYFVTPPLNKFSI